MTDHKKIADGLRRYNAWRRNNDEDLTLEMPDPKELGIWIDSAIAVLDAHAENNDLAQRVETPSSHWSADGKPDPHGKTYDCERAGLHMGNLTDDELANGAFLNYDQPLNVAGILAGTYHPPIAWMTAVKDRIRWLSRSLEKAVAERDALTAELARHDAALRAMVCDYTTPEAALEQVRYTAKNHSDQCSEFHARIVKLSDERDALAAELQKAKGDRDIWAAERERQIEEKRAMAAELKALREQEPFRADDERFRAAFDASIHQGNWPSARKGYGYRSPMTQMAWQVAFSTVCKLDLHARPAPVRRLIDEEIAEISIECAAQSPSDILFALAIEAALFGDKSQSAESGYEND